jgi:hypothetical protein
MWRMRACVAVGGGCLRAPAASPSPRVFQHAAAIERGINNRICTRLQMCSRSLAIYETAAALTTRAAPPISYAMHVLFPAAPCRAV